MFLKCETTLNVYEYKNKNILCRVKVLSSYCEDSSKSGSNPNTCRYLNADQWQDFDRHLKSWLNLNVLFESPKEGMLNEWHSIVGQNVRVQIRKSKFAISDFIKCLQTDEDRNRDFKSALPFVLDCILDKIAILVPPTPTINTDEYEPLPTTSNLNISTISPLSYVPYTPSKRTRRLHSEYHVKTPGFHIRDNELSDDIYSPKPIVETDTIAQYKPAPIYRRSVSFDSQLSNVNEAIVETEEDERKDNDIYKLIRTKLKSKSRKPAKDLGEYVPQANELEIAIPAYKATPIEEDGKENGIKFKKDDNFSKEKSEEKKSSRDNKNKEKRSKSYETDRENRKENKDTKSDRHLKDSKKILNSSYSSEDEFEQALRKQSSRDKNKDHRKEKKPEEKLKKNLDPSTINLEENKTSKSKDHRRDNRSEEKLKRTEDENKSSKNKEKDVAKSKSKTESKPTPAAITIRRSERSPSKPKRFINEQEEDCVKSRKKIKSHSSSPQKNKELFGTDDDDEDFVKIKPNSSNNYDRNSKNHNLQTPRHEKNKSSPLVLSSSSSLSPSSSAKKKRKRPDCEQEKSGMSKWLGKKNSSSSKSSEKNSYETSASSKDTKSSTKKSKTERQKSPSPASTLDIVMPSKEELEELRNKNKMQKERNEIVKAALQKLHASPPKYVEYLSLKDMSLQELLSTLDLYKNDLDCIYEKNCKKDYVKGNDGVNHCLVISLIDQKIQLKMIEKLSDVYNTSNHIAQATLFANALLPEWIVRIFMDKFNFSRHQAIKHIENQDAYISYRDAQNDSTLQFFD